MDHTHRPAPAARVGIDVSQHTLDACPLPAPDAESRSASYANDAAGHAALLAWADDHSPDTRSGFCPESTGPTARPSTVPAATSASSTRRGSSTPA